MSVNASQLVRCRSLSVDNTGGVQGSLVFTRGMCWSLCCVQSFGLLRHIAWRRMLATHTLTFALVLSGFPSSPHVFPPSSGPAALHFSSVIDA